VCKDRLKNYDNLDDNKPMPTSLKTSFFKREGNVTVLAECHLFACYTCTRLLLLLRKGFNVQARHASEGVEGYKGKTSHTVIGVSFFFSLV
jgi:hypothetical protein